MFKKTSPFLIVFLFLPIAVAYAQVNPIRSPNQKRAIRMLQIGER